MDCESRPLKWYTHLGDFINTLKAFIGTNYQALPFAFANSGLAFGIAGVFIIATLTDHCCQLLISCKKRLIEQLCASSVDLSLIDPSEQSQLRARLHLTIGYGDVGRRAFGPWCFHLIQLVVCFTQFTTCVAYFIFIGNTVYAIFPLHYTNHTNISSLTNHTNVTYLQLTELPDVHSTAIKSASDNIGESFYSSFMSDTDILFTSMNDTVYVTEESTAPDLKLIVLWVLPVFLITSLVRNVRYLAPLSLISSIALGVAIVMVLAFLIKDFSVNDQFVWYRFATLPLFFNQLISAYEGIGCILPIHCSMVGSRHMLRYYIHSNVYLIFFVLCTFGTVGYLRYGPTVEQLLVSAIEQHTNLSYVVDGILLLSVVFTYPLQCFPVIEILERYILVGGQCRQPAGNVNDLEYESVSTNEPTSDDADEQKNLLTESLRIELSTTRVAGPDIDSVAAWKRNTLRVVLTLVAAGLAVLLRYSYAYVAAFTGAVGCSLLAFILPCLFDIKLRGRSLPRVLLIKDVVIIVMATGASISGLVYIGIVIYHGGQPS